MYELPRAVQVRLSAAVRTLRNGEAVLRLARFLARFHSSPRTLGRAFPVDRLALAAHAELDLSESKIRGALKTLEEIGFLDRNGIIGSAYRRTAHGLRRKPVLFRFSADFFAIFARANRTARTKHLSVARRTLPQPAPVLANKQRFRGDLPLGEQPQPNAGLEAALSRWGAAIAGRGS